jgi:hypothetical protein
MTDQDEHDDWPECQPPEPPENCPGCGEAFTETRPYSHALGRTPMCTVCVDLYYELKAAAYADEHDARWPGNYALAALDLDEAGQRQAAGLYAALGWCDQLDTPGDTLRTLLVDGAKPPPGDQVRHEWVTGRRPPSVTGINWPDWVEPGPGFTDDAGWQSCARCGAVRYQSDRW